MNVIDLSSVGAPVYELQQTVIALEKRIYLLEQANKSAYSTMDNVLTAMEQMTNRLKNVEALARETERKTL